MFPEILYSLFDGMPWPLDRIDYTHLRLSTDMGINYTSWTYYLENGIFAAPFHIGPAILSGLGLLPLGWQVYTFLRLAYSPYSYVRAFFVVSYAQIIVIGVCEFIVYRRDFDDAVALIISLAIIVFIHFSVWLYSSWVKRRKSGDTE